MTVREAEALRDLWADYLRRDDRPPLMPPADTKAEVQLGKLLRRDPIPVSLRHAWSGSRAAVRVLSFRVHHRNDVKRSSETERT